MVSSAFKLTYDQTSQRKMPIAAIVALDSAAAVRKPISRKTEESFFWPGMAPDLPLQRR